MSAVEVARGAGPIVLGMPHGSTHVPEDVWSGLNETGRALTDTDWRIDQLFTGVLDDATTVRAGFHRYVIDANRDPSGVNLYPGQATTELCPTTDFDGAPIHAPGQAPTDAEISRRLETFHAPYHAALDAEIARIHDQHAHVLLFDCHSIRSIVPRLFEGVLPVLNIGTNNGVTCAPALERRVVEIAEASDFPSVLNGRFRGGWTTRRVGQPDTRVHAIQMEIAQRAYLAEETPPWTFDPETAAPLRAVLAEMLAALRAELTELR